jgi:hypothetical protein
MFDNMQDTPSFTLVSSPIVLSSVSNSFPEGRILASLARKTTNLKL